MTHPSIEIRQLGKQYRLGLRRERYGSLRDSLAHGVRTAGRNLRNLFAGNAAGQGAETFWALRDISFEVMPGEVVGIIGANGAGKSTLLKILSRITEPTTGEAILRGRVGSLLEVGTGFHPELTGRENIFLSGAILGMSKAEIRGKLDAIVAFAEIDKFLDTPAKRYSSGMYVRLGFAVAAHLEPEILLVDEVLAVGDASFRKKCMGRMQEVSQSGRTIFFVSHNMAQIRRLCGRAVWLEKGGVREIGNPNEITIAYEQQAVATPQLGGGVFDREGPVQAPVVMRRISLYNEQGECGCHFDYGQDLVIELELESDAQSKGQALDEVGVVWHLTDEGDMRISSGASEWMEKTYAPGAGPIRCRLRQLPLYAGDYKLSVRLFRLGTGLIDSWRDAAVFHIDRCSPLSTGFEFDRKSGHVYIDHQWE